MSRAGESKSTHFLALLVALAVSAPVIADSSREEQTETHAGQSGVVPEAVNEFHNTLVPLWHAQPGPSRTDITCSRVENLRSLGREIESEPAPQASSGDEAEWQKRVKVLTHRVDELSKVCSQEDRPEFEQALTGVHDAFHELIAYFGSKH